MRIVVHALILTFAIGLTLVTFNFWGDFAEAVRAFLSAPSAPPPDQPVMVNILPASPPPPKPACPKGRKCP